MRIALVCPDLTGHLNPSLTLADELARRGHELFLAVTPKSAAKVTGRGHRVIPIAVLEHESGQSDAGTKLLAELTGLKALKLTGKLLGEMTEIMIRDLPQAMQEHRIEAMIVDQVSPVAGSVAEVLNLPYVMICNALAMNQETGVPPPVLPWRYRPGALGKLRNWCGNFILTLAAKPIYRITNKYRQQHGLPPIQRGMNDTRCLALIAQQPAFFDFPRQRLPKNFHYTAPWHAPGRDRAIDFPWEKLDGRPLIYASLGTLQNRLMGIFDNMAQAVRDLDVQLVISLGRADAIPNLNVPPNVIVVPYAPQLALIDKASLVITHAGLNTTLESIRRGVPMLALPVTNDQPGVARRLEYLGVGEVIPLKQATVPWLKTLISKILATPAYREKAAIYRQQLEQSPGVTQAGDIVERCLLNP